MARVLVVNSALPPPRVAVPIWVVPSLKLTVPTGTPRVDETVAVKVTALPLVDGFRVETTVVAVAALSTVCVKTDVLL